MAAMTNVGVAFMAIVTLATAMPHSIDMSPPLAEDCITAFAQSPTCLAATGVDKSACDVFTAACSALLLDNPISDVVNHMPAEDHDHDDFSHDFGLRGYAWRGRDCDDKNGDVYPGRRTPPANDNGQVDFNCNGIVGANASGTFEEQFCGGDYAPRGVILLSDSTGAHFDIPLRPPRLNEWPKMFLTEVSWPECSWGTAWETDIKKCDGPDTLHEVDSIYKRMYQRNRCNFKDYQNIAVNGMRSGPMADQLVNTTSRSQLHDAPALVFYSEVANDVCNPHNDTINHMTPIPQYKANVLSALKQLDAKLPKGSTVVFMGYLKGELYYNAMKDKPYPFFGMTYADAWAFVSNATTGGKKDPRSMNPCYGWLNPNATLRAFTTQRARDLEGVYLEIINTTSFASFDMHYMDLPDGDILTDWIAAGKNPAELVSQVGGVHPSVVGSSLWAKAIWDKLESEVPHALGPVNPHNDEIEAMFGDQGGYGPHE